MDLLGSILKSMDAPPTTEVDRKAKGGEAGELVLNFHVSSKRIWIDEAYQFWYETYSVHNGFRLFQIHFGKDWFVTLECNVSQSLN